MISRLPPVRVVPPPADDASVPAWIAEHMDSGRPFLLVHDDSGIVWGRWVDGRLRTAADVFPDFPGATPLRGITLQQAFLFGPQGEVRLFRDELGQWQARRISEEGHEDCIDEWPILVGNQVAGKIPGESFTALKEEDENALEQVLPIPIDDSKPTTGPAGRARLHVRHFVDYDRDTGEARIALSRLVDIRMFDLNRETPDGTDD